MKKTRLSFFSKFSLFIAGLIAGVFVGYIIFAETGLFVSLSGKENYHLVEDGVVAGIDLQWFGSNEKPTSNTAQNQQFDYAVKEIEKSIERDLTPKEVRELHETISKASPPYTRDEIIEEGIGFYGKK